MSEAWKRLLWAEARRILTLERRSVQTSRAVTLVSDAEAAVLRSALGIDPGNVYGLSNGVDSDYFDPLASFPARTSPPLHSSPAPPSATVFRLVFIGALNYHPNVDGLRWFAAEVWPTLCQRFPGITLAVVGRNPNAQVRSLDRIEGIHVIGPVDDVRPHVAAADAVVAPLRIARGIQNKVLEAMAMGKPVIATAEAVEGIEATVGRDLIIAGTAEEWVDAFKQLAEQPELSKRYGAAARKLVLDRYNWQQRLKSLDQLLGIDSAAIDEPITTERERKV